MNQTNGEYTEEQKRRRRHLDSAYANPIHLDWVAGMSLELPLTVAHNGSPYYLESWAVALAPANVYLDISGPWTEGIPVVRTSLGGAAFIPIDFDRVLWGSDNWLPQKERMARAVMYLRQMGADKR